MISEDQQAFIFKYSATLTKDRLQLPSEFVRIYILYLTFMASGRSSVNKAADR